MIRNHVQKASMLSLLAIALPLLVNVTGVSAFNPQPDPPGKQITGAPINPGELKRNTLGNPGVINPGEIHGALNGSNTEFSPEALRALGQKQASEAAKQAALAMQEALRTNQRH